MPGLYAHRPGGGASVVVTLFENGKGPFVARMRPDASTAGPPSSVDSSAMAEQELAVLVLRAAAIGIPAWRVTTALGVPPMDGTSGDSLPPTR